MKLYNWSQDWQMDFNVDKCKVVHIGRNNPEYKYSMNRSVLQEVKQEKDLGIMITSDLKSFCQVTEAYKKANRALGMINRLTHTTVLLVFCKHIPSIDDLFRKEIFPQVCSTVMFHQLDTVSSCRQVLTPLE